MTPFNEHIRLAQAMLHGHLYIDSAPLWMEHITVDGHDYILHPPLSAFVCLPFVAIGITDQTFICELLALASVALVWKLTHELWLAAFFALGTTMLYEATNGASWDFALICSTPFTLAAIICIGEGPSRATVNANSALNLVGGPSPFLVGLFASLAALARYDLVLAWPVYLWIIRRQENENTNVGQHRTRGYRDNRWSRVYICNEFQFLIGASLWVVVYTWFNEARFGTLTDGSIAEWYWHYDKFRAQRPFGPFALQYIPFNVYTLVFMAPAYQGAFPWIRPQFMGQALLSLSPGFLAVKVGPWLMAAMLTSLPALTVYASGFSQLGCRYYIQVFPFLIASMTSGNVRTLSVESRALIIISIISSQYFTIVAWTYGLN